MGIPQATNKGIVMIKVNGVNTTSPIIIAKVTRYNMKKNKVSFNILPIFFISKGRKAERVMPSRRSSRSL